MLCAWRGADYYAAVDRELFWIRGEAAQEIEMRSEEWGNDRSRSGWQKGGDTSRVRRRGDEVAYERRGAWDRVLYRQQDSKVFHRRTYTYRAGKEEAGTMRKESSAHRRRVERTGIRRKLKEKKSKKTSRNLKNRRMVIFCRDFKI